MTRIVLVVSLIFGLISLAWAQEEVDPAATAQAATPASEVSEKQSAASTDVTEERDSQAGDEEVDGEGAFSPTEEIRVDSPVSFPVDI